MLTCRRVQARVGLFGPRNASNTAAHLTVIDCERSVLVSRQLLIQFASMACDHSCFWSSLLRLRAPVTKSILLVIFELACIVSASAQTLIHTSQTIPSQPPAATTTVQAASASDFLNSIGVACHFDYYWTAYQNFPKVEALLLQSGIRNIRDGGTDPIAVSSFRALHNDGIDVTWVMDAIDGVAPTSAYWTAPPHYTLPSFLENVLGTSTISAIEISNEIDIYYGTIKWHPSDHDYLSGNYKASNYWGSYIQSLVQDTSTVVHQDAALASIPLIGTSFGGTWAGVPAGAFYPFVDQGAIHPYMYRGNATVTNAAAYDGVPHYFLDSTEPSVLMDEYPTAITNFNYPYQSGSQQKPLVATETGYFTGHAPYSIDESRHAKYIPRIFAESFRHSIAKTFVYEFVDEGLDGGQESSFGLVRADLTPKPAYTALQSMLALLQDSGGSFSPAELTYGFVPSQDQSYTRLQYAHDLLLQKRDGDFFLLFWHEISDANRVNSYGDAIGGTDPDASPGALPAVITVPANITQATLYSYDTNWKLQATPMTIKDGRITVQVSDELSVVQLQTAATAPSPTPTATTTTLRASASQIVAGQSFSLTATVTASSGSETPSGTVSFYQEKTQIGAATLAGGTATLSVASGFSAGSYSLTASYSGNSMDDASTSSPVTLTVAPIVVAPVVVATATTLSIQPQQPVAGQTMTWQVNVGTAVAGTKPSGAVTLYLNGSPIDLLTIAGGTGTFSIKAPSQAGTYTASAVFAAQGDYLTSQSSPVTFTVPAVTTVAVSGSFAVALSNDSVSLSVVNPQPASLQVAVSTSGNYTGSIQLGCSGLPAGVSCSFSPASLTVNSTKVTSTLVMSGPAVQAANDRMAVNLERALLLPWGVLSLFGIAWRRRPHAAFLSLALLCTLLWTTGCGLTIHDVTRSYSVKVTASDQNNVTESTAFTLYVTQPGMTQ
jgi:Bacterial Ig-like domain (group 3)